jgi:hypothetical protein
MIAVLRHPVRLVVVATLPGVVSWSSCRCHCHVGVVSCRDHVISMSLLIISHVVVDCHHRVVDVKWFGWLLSFWFVVGCCGVVVVFFIVLLRKFLSYWCSCIGGLSSFYHCSLLLCLWLVVTLSLMLSWSLLPVVVS